MNIVNNRQVIYLDTKDTGWETSLPAEEWLAFAIADNEQISRLDSLAATCLDKNVLYICAAGEAGSQVDDAFDRQIVNRKITNSEDIFTEGAFKNAPMTTWHDDFEEGFWFASAVAYHKTIDIKKIVVINLTNTNYRDKIAELIEMINAGWLPQD